MSAMPDYHRTQVQLEKWQYELLKERASEEDVSLSEFVRRLLTEEFGPPAEGSRQRLEELRGKWTDPGFSSQDHDEAIYGVEDE